MFKVFRAPTEWGDGDHVFSELTDLLNMEIYRVYWTIVIILLGKLANEILYKYLEYNFGFQFFMDPINLSYLLQYYFVRIKPYRT